MRHSLPRNHGTAHGYFTINGTKLPLDCNLLLAIVT
jgi:hypothetical protein